MNTPRKLLVSAVLMLVVAVLAIGTPGSSSAAARATKHVRPTSVAQEGSGAVSASVRGGLAAGVSADRLAGTVAVCGKGMVVVVVNRKATVCVTGAGFFGQTANDQAVDSVVSGFVGGSLWKSLAGSKTVAAGLGVRAAGAARWQSGVFAAARAALRKQTGGRELLARRGSGPFEVVDFASNVPAPPGFDQVKSTLSGLERERQQLLQKESSASAVASGPVGKLEFVITSSWEFDGCPDTQGDFLAKKTLTLNRTFTSVDGVASVERVTVVAVIRGTVNENARLGDFDVNVLALATDSRGGKWQGTMNAENIEGGLTSKPMWVGGTGGTVSPPSVGLTVKNVSVPPPASIKSFIEEVLKQATEEARKDAEANLAAAFDVYYTKHLCNKIRFTPSKLTLKPGQSATVKVRMPNTSRRPGDPIWKAQKVTGQGVEVLNWTKSKSKSPKTITIRAPKGGKRLQSTTSSGSLAVDGVSIRGRGLDSLSITIADGAFPKMWVGQVSGTAQLTCCGQNITATWTGQVRFVLTYEKTDGPLPNWYYDAVSGSVTWSVSGKDGPCTVRGEGTVPILKTGAPGYQRAVTGALTLWQKGERYYYKSVITGVPPEVSPVTKSGCDGGGQLNQSYIEWTLYPFEKPMQRDDRALSGSVSVTNADVTAKWNWSFSAIN